MGGTHVGEVCPRGAPLWTHICASSWQCLPWSPSYLVLLPSVFVALMVLTMALGPLWSSSLRAYPSRDDWGLRLGMFCGVASEPCVGSLPQWLARPTFHRLAISLRLSRSLGSGSYGCPLRVCGPYYLQLVRSVLERVTAVARRTGAETVVTVTRTASPSSPPPKTQDMAVLFLSASCGFGEAVKNVSVGG